MEFFKLYITALPTFLVIDFVWLGFVAKKMYSHELGHLMKTDINWVAAIAFYLLFIVGLVVFVIAPSVERKSLVSAIVLGGLFGLVSYATYDLTNLATLKNWSFTVTIVDLIWGMVLSGLVSTITYLISSRIGF